MADGVAITAGSGTTVATDDCGASGHTQIVKLAIATNASATLLPGDATNGLQVDLGPNNDTVPGGNVAHDAADSGNPIKVGYKAESSPKGITLVADGDRTDGYADIDGIQIVKLGTAYGDIVCDAISNTDGASTASAVFTAVASTKNYITAVTAFNSSAAACTLAFRDGTGGSTLYTVLLPAGGGVVIGTGASPIFKTSANTALAYDASAATTTVYVNATGFQSKV